MLGTLVCAAGNMDNIYGGNGVGLFGQEYGVQHR